MNKEEKKEIIANRIIEFLMMGWDTPKVFLFDLSEKDIYEELVDHFSNLGINLIDVNQYATITPEDYNIRLKDIGYDVSENITIKDTALDEVEKRERVTWHKLDRLKDVIQPHKTILLITYNDVYLSNKTAYEYVRSLLKDGYWPGYKPIALVLLETKKDIGDFCPYHW